MKRVILLIITCILLTSGCAPNKNTYKKKGEFVEVRMSKTQIWEHHGGGDAIEDISSPITAVLPILTNWGVNRIKTIIDKEAKKYKATYSKTYVADDFYEVGIKKTKLTRDLRYNEIHIERFISIKNDSSVNAMKLVLKINKNNTGNFLYLQPAYLIINKSKAKLRRSDNDIDLIINIKIKSAYINKKQEYKNQELADLTFVIKNIVLEKEYVYGIWGSHFLKDINLGSIKHDKELDMKSDWFPSIPISYDKKGKMEGDGNFSIIVTITEVDDFGKRITKMTEEFKNNDPKLLNALINSLVE